MKGENVLGRCSYSHERTPDIECVRVYMCVRLRLVYLNLLVMKMTAVLPM